MIPDDLLQNIKELVASDLGLDFMSSRDYDIEKGLISLGREHGIKGSDRSLLVKWLETVDWNQETLDSLARYLTVGETFFFREKPHLEVFREVIIPDLLKRSTMSGKPALIWSAGCCTGEEPYTLAMILREVVPEKLLRHFTIIGTDINHEFLHSAQRGSYRVWSFRETREEIRQQFFLKTGDTWIIRDEVKAMVTFRYFNLAGTNDLALPSGPVVADVIFCRNVLMYFTHAQFLKVTGRFFRALNEGGFLVPGIVEVNDAEFSVFEPVSYKNCTLYRKSGNRTLVRPRTALSIPVATPSQTNPPPGLKNVKETPGRPRKINQGQIRPAEMRDTAADPSMIFNTADYRKCIEICSSLLQKDPGNILLLSLMVRSYANTGKLDEASRWASVMLDKPGADAGHYYLAATVHTEMDNHTDASSLLKKALYLDPRHLPSHFLMGRVAVKLGKPDLSKRHFINALDLLDQYQEEEPVPQADGLNAGRMREMIRKSIAML